jgi:hypothetical protein
MRSSSMPAPSSPTSICTRLPNCCALSRMMPRASFPWVTRWSGASWPGARASSGGARRSARASARPASASDYPDAVPCVQRHPALLSTTIHGKTPQQIYDKLEGMNYGCMAQKADRGCVAATFRTPAGASFLLLNFCPDDVDNVVTWDRSGFVYTDDSSGATLGFSDSGSQKPLAELAKHVLELDDAL